MFLEARRVFYNYSAKAFALLCVIAFIVFVTDFFSAPGLGDLYKGHWAGCGDFQALKHDATMFDQDVLALEIRDVQPAKFLLSGRLELSRATYLKSFKDAKGILVELDRLSSSPSLMASVPNWIKVERPQAGDIGDQRQVTLNLKDYELGEGTLWKFPFDEYRFGFTTSVHVIKPDAKSYRQQPIDATIININLSNAFVVQKVMTIDQFMRNPELSGVANLKKQYTVDQCALIINRPIWYQAMIGFLLTLLFAPAIYIFYKRDADPGIELIAAILGVAAIRGYFLGGFTEWNFYLIDILFALSILLTAVIALWRLPMRSKLKG